MTAVEATALLKQASQKGSWETIDIYKSAPVNSIQLAVPQPIQYLKDDGRAALHGNIARQRFPVISSARQR